MLHSESDRARLVDHDSLRYSHNSAADMNNAKRIKGKALEVVYPQKTSEHLKRVH